MKVPSDFPYQEQWKNLKTNGVAITACVCNGTESVEKRYYISSLPIGVKQFARSVRGH